MTRFLTFTTAAALLAGCASTPPDPVEQTVTAAPAADPASLARLAQDVSARLAAIDEAQAARLTPVELELRRVADALADVTPRALQQAAAEPAQQAAPAYAPAPELAGARSLYHAVRLGVYPTRESAEGGWMALAMARGAALGALKPRIEEEPDGFALKAGPLPDRASAETACRELQSAGARCGVTDFTGESF